MISYHPIKPGSCNNPQQYYRNFIAVETDDVRRIGICVKNYCWSPVEYSGGLRRKANFVKANWLALDFDNGEMSIEDAVNTFCDMVCIIGTTKSHSPDLHRFRVILRMERPCTNYLEYEYNLKKITSLYPCDPAPKDAARFFWPCKDVVYSSGHGYMYDVLNLPKNHEETNFNFNRKYFGYAETSTLPRDIRLQLEAKIPHGLRNKQTFIMGCKFARCGYGLSESFEKFLKSGCCDLELEEMERCFSNGFNAVMKELINERKK